MSATERRQAPFAAARRQAGVAAAEFAILAVLFFTLVLSVMELARAMYVFNTMYEATRYAANAASMTSHRDSASLERIRQHAMLRTSPGPLPLGAPVTDRNVRIDYLALTRDDENRMSLQEIPTASLPLCPRQNREICMTDPNAANCIRFVRARICAEDNETDCDPAAFVSYLPVLSFTFDLPLAATVRPTESFGSMPEGTPCL